METIQITVLHYYNHPVLYAFMPQSVFELLEEAFINDQEKATVPRSDYDSMIESYFDILRN